MSSDAPIGLKSLASDQATAIIERAADAGNERRGNLGVASGRPEVGVAKQDLDDAEIDPTLSGPIARGNISPIELGDWSPCEEELAD